jgi:hypothetical protein
MRRGTLMLAAMAVMVSLLAAVAYAATIEGTRQSETLQESNLNDTIFGRGGRDFIDARTFGNDTDRANGNAGNDLINVTDGDGLDTANGGKGVDTCHGDTVAELNCENEFAGGDLCQREVTVLGPTTVTSPTVDSTTFTTTGNAFRVEYSVDFANLPTPPSSTIGAEIRIERLADGALVQSQSVLLTEDAETNSFDVAASPDTYRLVVQILNPNGATYRVTVFDCLGTTPTTPTTASAVSSG